MKPKKPNQLFRVIVFFILLVSFVPVSGVAKALALPVPPPLDMFQWPWDQGASWVAFDGFDNGTKRLPTSPHNYQMGGSVDFAPHNNMVIGEDTSNFWVTAAAAGTVIGKSSCHLIIDHGNGWTTEYWHLDKIQVNLGSLVSRNQRLAVIADSKFQNVCPGNEFPGPHLHFVMRPKMIQTIFSGWKINFNVLTNITTYTKNGQTVSRNQPILNTPNLQIFLREPIVWDTSYKGSVDAYRYEKWPLQLTEQTKFDITVAPAAIGVVPLIVLLNANGSEIARGSGTLTSTQPAGAYFVQIQSDAGTGFYNLIAHNDNLSGTTVTPTPTIGTPVPTNTLVTGTPAGSQTPVVTSTPTFTPPPMTPTISPTTCNQAELTGYVNIPPGTLMPPGTTFTQSWGLRNIGWCTWTTAYHLVFYSGDQMSAPISVNIASYDVAPSQLIIVSVPFTAPIINGHYTSLWKLRDASGIQFGVGALANDPLVLDINVSNPNATPASPTPTISPIPSITPGGPTLTATSTPIATGTAIITEPYVLTSANPLNLNVGNIGLVTVSLNNIPAQGYTSTEFTCTYNANLVEVSNISVAGLFGTDSVSAMNGPQNGTFILAIAGSNSNRAAGSGTAFTFNVRGLQTGQTPVECKARVSNGDKTLASILSISANLNILGIPPSSTPTSTPIPAVPVLTGQVFASKPVTIRLYNADNSIAASVAANADGTFNLTASAGTYTVIANADGFLNAQGIALLGGNTAPMPIISLIAGDIDGNGVIDQFDALTIGMSYNTAVPAAADLNNDGIINVIDLEILARNYRRSGALAWNNIP